MHDIREVAKEIMEGRHKERQVQSVERQGTRDLVRVLLNIQDTRGNEHGSRCDESLTEHIVRLAADSPLALHISYQVIPRLRFLMPALC
jgi:hypothetical protein